MLQSIVDRCHVGSDYGTVRRYVVSTLKHGYQTWSGLPRDVRRDALREISRMHRENRELYNAAMGGRF